MVEYFTALLRNNYTLSGWSLWIIRYRWKFINDSLRRVFNLYLSSNPEGNWYNKCLIDSTSTVHFVPGSGQYCKTPQLEQLERLRSEDTPRRLMITHTIESCWIPSQNKVEWPWRYRSRSKVITCDTPSHVSNHLYQIWKESIHNRRRYRGWMTLKIYVKVKSHYMRHTL